jgi:hypothetical protein
MVLMSTLALVGCGNGSLMDIEDCAITSSRRGTWRFVADVFNHSEKPIASFSAMAASTGTIVFANGNNVVNYDIMCAHFPPALCRT